MGLALDMGGYWLGAYYFGRLARHQLVIGQSRASNAASPQSLLSLLESFKGSWHGSFPGIDLAGGCKNRATPSILFFFAG